MQHLLSYSLFLFFHRFFLRIRSACVGLLLVCHSVYTSNGISLICPAQGYRLVHLNTTISLKNSNNNLQISMHGHKKQEPNFLGFPSSNVGVCNPKGMSCHRSFLVKVKKESMLLSSHNARSSLVPAFRCINLGVIAKSQQWFPRCSASRTFLNHFDVILSHLIGICIQIHILRTPRPSACCR